MDNCPSVIDVLALKIFECPVCMEYYQKPILQCPTGHSICSKCRPKLVKCPSCAVAYSNTRNYALESILCTMKAECKNEDCTKIIPLHNYSQHVNDQCPFRSMKCKSPNCTWSDNKHLVNQHIKSVHSSLVVRKFAKLESHQLTHAFVEHNDIMFSVHRYIDERVLIWTAEPTVHVNTSNLSLVVKIITGTGQTQILKQPITSMDNSNLAKEKSVICMLKSKAKLCEFQLSIEQENIEQNEDYFANFGRTFDVAY